MDWSVILSSCIVAATTIISLFLKDFLQKKKNQASLSVEKCTIQNTNVEKAIRYTLDVLNADRVSVYEFHNGESFYSGSHQQKFSCTYEYFKAGVSSEALGQQGLRVSTFNQFVSQIINEKIFKYSNTQNLDDSLLKNWFEDKGVKSIVAIPIITLNKNIIGMISVESTTSNKTLTEKEIKFLIEQSKIICGYLI
jgi:hypothetical protein